MLFMEWPVLSVASELLTKGFVSMGEVSGTTRLDLSELEIRRRMPFVLGWLSWIFLTI